ncbi:hypothetical protein [Nonomuraea sp. LPB2021202275-12-8]|uniref:hypothetical protein n=1 Tax=Nonomuraea sp. LPB2021202275-12-8 TaxID=3120159 RepID=UPI00300CECD5
MRRGAIASEMPATPEAARWRLTVASTREKSLAVWLTQIAAKRGRPYPLTLTGR